MTTSKTTLDKQLIDYAYQSLNHIPKNSTEYERMISGVFYNPNDPVLMFRRDLSNLYIDEFSKISLKQIIKDHENINDDKQLFIYLSQLSASANAMGNSDGANNNTKEQLAKLASYSDLLQRQRTEFLRNNVLGHVGEGSFFEPPLYVDYGFNISVGRNFYCNFNCVLLDCSIIKIGNDVMLGPGVNILTASHPLDGYSRCHLGKELTAPVFIGDECWLGANAIICPGVTLGKGVVVAAGAVVTKNFKDNVLVAGVPAKVIKEIKEPLTDEEKEAAANSGNLQELNEKAIHQ